MARMLEIVADCRRAFLFVVLLLLAVGASPHRTAADEAEAPAITTLKPAEWLALPAIEVPEPALQAAASADAEGDEEVDVLDRISLPLDDFWPVEGDRLAWPGLDDAPRWQRLAAADGVVDADPGSGVRVLALYVENDAFVKPTLTVTGSGRVRVVVDGEVVVDKKDSEPSAEKGVDLEPGTHVVVAFAAAGTGEEPAEGTGSGFGLALGIADERAGQVRFGTDPAHELMIDELLDMEVVTGVSVSADGAIAAIGMRTPQPPSKDQRAWIEFVATDGGQLLQSLEGVGNVNGLSWAPEGRRYAFTTRAEEATTLWIADFGGGRPRVLREGLKDFGSFRWMPSASSIVYSVSEEGEKDPENVKRYRGLTDRWAGNREQSFLYQISVPDGVSRRLTAGELGTSLQDIAPDGRTLLFTRTVNDDATWPFSTETLYELDLEGLQTRELTSAGPGLSARYSPNGNDILITASPSAFGELGENVPEGVIANLYDTQAYLLGREDGEMRAISRDFDPAIEGVEYSRASGDILARATVQTRHAIFRYDSRREQWSELETPVGSIGRMDLSADGRTVIFEGDGAFEPWQVMVASLDGRWRPKAIRTSDLDMGGRILAGHIEDFDFTSSAGDVIDGHVYFPAGYDESRAWPALVYYYGGTSPVTRDFGGRYPKEYWAARGYVVYVLEPSGATGYGQEFSARHVNDWGKTTIDEIIEGTQAFLAAHPAVDPERVGCLGASYGGFMTELLMTRTDMFAAAISHAGISSISSYWGEGNWGYGYSAAATAHSYPWNRPDIYVDQSALFAADKIVTPLLLLHGSDDDNVPPGESEQLYTALRVLGRPVEYIRIAGEKHWILEREKRDLWARTIVAWFDRWLKGDQAWWDHLYTVSPE